MKAEVSRKLDAHIEDVARRYSAERPSNVSGETFRHYGTQITGETTAMVLYIKEPAAESVKARRKLVLMWFYWVGPLDSGFWRDITPTYDFVQSFVQHFPGKLKDIEGWNHRQNRIFDQTKESDT